MTDFAEFRNTKYTPITLLNENVKLILATGMLRSGSTWLFNICRLLLESYPNTYSCWVDDYDEILASKAQTVLVKLHAPDVALAERADVVVTSFRDLRDVAASVLDMGWFSKTSELTKCAMSARYCDEFWSTHANLRIGYHEITKDPEQVTYKLADVLGISIEKSSIEKIMIDLDNMKPNIEPGYLHDKTNLLHIKHKLDGRPGSWSDRLSVEASTIIEEENWRWLTDNGYEIQPANGYRNEIAFDPAVVHAGFPSVPN